MKDLNKIILKDKKKYNRKINLNLKIDSSSKNYVEYPRNDLKNYYNEIYQYLIDNEVLPKRLEYSKNKNRKTVEKKGVNFENYVRKNIEYLQNVYNILIIIKIN